MRYLVALLASATLAHAEPEQTPVLVFITPDYDVIVAAYDTPEDCDEVQWALNRWVKGPAHYICEPETALEETK
jgi:hypothetical protein